MTAERDRPKMRSSISECMRAYIRRRRSSKMTSWMKELGREVVGILWDLGVVGRRLDLFSMRN